MEQYKTCSKCKQSKLVENFTTFSKSKDGYRPWCKLCVKAYNESYQLQNKDAISKSKKIYKQKNQAYLKSYYADYYQRNKISLRARNKEWIKNNPERYAQLNSIWGATRRARLRQAKRFFITANDVARLLNKPCTYCGSEATELDHVIPLARGGNHGIGNLTPACRPCNASKSGRFVMEWRCASNGDFKSNPQKTYRTRSDVLALRD